MPHISILMLCLVALLSVHSDLSRAESPQPRRRPPRQSDLQKLQGKWRTTELSLFGRSVEEYQGDELVCVFLDGKVTIYREGKMIAVCEYSFDVKQRSAIDFAGKALPTEWGDGKGIYAVDGDQLRLSFDPVSKGRPKELGSSWVTVFERKPIDF